MSLIKNSFTFLFCCLFSIQIYAQIKNGSIQYGLVFSQDKELESGIMASYFAEAKKNAKYISFTLNFNENEMCFFKNNTLNSDGVDISFAIAFSGVNGKIYKEKNSNVVLNEQDNNDFGKIIVRKELVTNWTLTKESKLIDNYICYKATTIIDIKNSVGTFKRDIVAWYCPKIPISFGPKGHSGLPGLILELQEKGVVFGAKKINLNLKKIEIKKPVQGKYLTEKELNKVIDENSNK
jgi:GLPGLI family protein